MIPLYALSHNQRHDERPGGGRGRPVKRNQRFHLFGRGGAYDTWRIGPGRFARPHALEGLFYYRATSPVTEAKRAGATVGVTAVIEKNAAGAAWMRRIEFVQEAQLGFRRGPANASWRTAEGWKRLPHKPRAQTPAGQKPSHWRLFVVRS